MSKVEDKYARYKGKNPLSSECHSELVSESRWNPPLNTKQTTD